MRRMIPGSVIRRDADGKVKINNGVVEVSENKVDITHGDLVLSGDGDVKLGANSSLKIGEQGSIDIPDTVPQSVKKIYWHSIKFQRGGTAELPTAARLFGEMIILTNSATLITLDDFLTLLRTPGFYGVVMNGKYATGGTDLTGMNDVLIGIKHDPNQSNNFFAIYRDATTNIDTISASLVTTDSYFPVFEDLGANAIN